MNTASLRSLALAGLLLGAANLTSQAQTTNYLYAPPTSGARDNYGGAVGCEFEVGSSNVIVSYLGYFSTNTTSGLNISHAVGIMSANFSHPVLLGSVTVPAGTSALWASNYYWVQLNPPLLLSANTSYFLAGLPTSSDGDAWPDLFTPSWNTYFVGANGTGTRTGIYAPNNSSGSSVPPSGGFSSYGGNETYGAPEMANLPVGPALAGVLQSNVTIAAGSTLTVNGCGSGQMPMTNQWWKAGSPNTLVSTTTNQYANLVIANVTTTQSGTYFLTSSNALGGGQSVNVNVTVTASPVGISVQPTNVTAFNNYPVTVSVTVTGTPPISYQWYVNGAPISGATASSYSLFVSNVNNGNIFACVASNTVNATPYTATSHNATLTVLANLAYPQEFLHGYNSTLNNNTYQGQQGGLFTVGNNPVLVTHLAYYAWPANCTTNAGVVTCSLALDHHVGLFNAQGIGAGNYVPVTNLLGYVDVPAGNNTVINGYMWQPLNPPLVLAPNTTYLLVAETESDTEWGDTYAIPDLNAYFATSCAAIYGGNGWGSAPYLGGGYAGQMYSAPNMAILALPTPSAFVAPLTETQYVGLSASFTATVAGQAPVTLQWMQAPNTALSGQTNLSLTLNNLSLSENNNNYFVVATNTVTDQWADSTDAVLTVIADVGPTVVEDISNVVAYTYQTVEFAPQISGTPPFQYQWTFNGQAIPGATSSTLTLPDITPNNAGNYQLLVTNSVGSSNTSVANLEVINPTWGGYASGVMNPDLLLYYRFSDVSNYYYYGDTVATNQGSLGPAANGVYEGSCSPVGGPVIYDPDEPTNWAMALDGYSADVQVPSIGVTLTNCTIAAWVMDQGGQPDNATIFFHRQSSVFGLAIGQGQAGTMGEWLKVTWNNGLYNDETGLVLPTNEWAFVALVVTPTNFTVYLQNGTNNNLLSTNFTVANAPQSLSGVSYIGYDTAGSTTGRRWNGAIDEVMVLNQAYTPTQVRSLMLGVPASATLTIGKSGNHVVVGWPGGTLEEATSVQGPWTPTAGAANGSYTLTPSGASKFYRVKLQ